MKVKVSNFWLIVITVMSAVINYSWTTSSRQRVGRARTYSSVLPFVIIKALRVMDLGNFDFSAALLLFNKTITWSEKPLDASFSSGL